MIDSRDVVIIHEIHDKRSSMDNESSLRDISSLNEEYILDRTDIRLIFITLYTIVFVSCFLGKPSSRSRSIELSLKSPRQFRPYSCHALWSLPSIIDKKERKAANIVQSNKTCSRVKVFKFIYNVNTNACHTSQSAWLHLLMFEKMLNLISLNRGQMDEMLKMQVLTFRRKERIEKNPSVHTRTYMCKSRVVSLWTLLSGNSMVIFVVTFSRRLRSITNFFLANLAVADFCVGVFCVYQTLTNYLMNSWPLGDILCKVYMFVHALSYTASVLILMVVCIERYLAIVYPIKCRSVLTRSRLQLVIGIVWIVAAVYALPRFFYVETMENRLITGDVDVICIANIQKHNKTLLDAVNLVFLYLLPLLLMSCLYSRIAVGLRRSGTTLGGSGLATKSKDDSLHRVHNSSRNVLRARRGVIR